MRCLLLLVMTAGCRQLLGFENPTVTDAPVTPSDTVDAPIGCTAGEDVCPATAPICDGGICVECTADDLGICTSPEGICGSDNHCRGCQTHDECPTSNVCLPDGRCADPLAVAYVSGQGSGTACTQNTPCATLAIALATTRTQIKISGTITDTNQTNINAGSISIFADPGAVITRSNNGPLLNLPGSAVVSISDLTFSGATSSTGSGIKMDGGVLVLERVKLIGNGGFGIDARLANVTMRRCIVSGNLGGGADFDNATFDVSNSLFVRNGNAGTGIGGVRLRATATSKFELNTIADNASAGTSESGVRCEQMAVDAHSNIVSNNGLDTTCTFRASLFDALMLPTGIGNKTGDPKFLSTSALAPLAPDYYRIGPDSDAIDGAVSTIAIDIDGQPRPAGAADMGADERP